ncbi:MAG: cell division protein FtsA [Pseudomonadota bacterium]
MVLARAVPRLQAAGLTAVVDIGASKVSCLIASTGGGTVDAHEPVALDVLGAAQAGLATGERGQDRTASTETALRAAVDAAERMAGERVTRVHVAVAGRHLLSRRVGVDLALAGSAATREDVVDCLQKGAGVAAVDGATPLHALPTRFVIDGDDAGGNPCGLVGSVLTVEMLGLAVREGVAENLRALLERCDLCVDGYFAAPIAAADGSLIDDEKELGVLLLDIGARHTDFALFEDGAVTACGGVGVGGAHITRDLAQIFGGEIAHAERVKTLYGSALSGDGDDHRFVDFPQIGDPNDVNVVSRAEIAAVIAPRLEETFMLVLRRLQEGASARRAAPIALRRAVLTGGGAQVTGARETAERVLGVKTRLAKAAALSGAPDAVRAPQYAVCVGGMIRAADAGKRWRDRGDSFFDRDMIREGSVGVLRAAAAWLRANF